MCFAEPGDDLIESALRPDAGNRIGKEFGINGLLVRWNNRDESDVMLFTKTIALLEQVNPGIDLGRCEGIEVSIGQDAGSVGGEEEPTGFADDDAGVLIEGEAAAEFCDR